MGGNKTGGQKAAQKNKELYGENWYSRIGSIGGRKKGIKKGFALIDKETLSEYGRRGGSKSRKQTYKQRDNFIELWNAGVPIPDMARKLKIPAKSIPIKASALRKNGYDLEYRT